MMRRKNEILRCESVGTYKCTKNSQQQAKPKGKDTTDIGSGMGDNHDNFNLSSINKVLPIQNLEQKVLQYIIGQDEQVRQVITAIYRSIYFPTIKSNILMIGNSGVGKTETIKQVARRLNIPYTIEDATKYTQEGYYGADVTDMIYNLLDSAHNNIKKAESGIIVIDEIDKKVGHEEHDIAGIEVLKSLLKIIEGTILKIQPNESHFYENIIDFDTKKLIIVLMGAFSGLEKIRDKRLNKNQLGFSSCNTKKEKVNSEFTKKDLIDYGMTEEFVGRIDTIIEMNKLTKADLTSILKTSKQSIFRCYQSELSKRGVTLSYSSQIFDLIAEESLSIDTGARELSNIVNHMFEKIIYEILSNPGKFKKCVLNLEIVHDNSQYVLF